MSVLQMLKEALETECGVAPSMVSESTDLLTDLGIDSIDLLNASFALESLSGVKLPVREWLEKADFAGSPNSPFVVHRICDYISSQV